MVECVTTGKPSGHGGKLKASKKDDTQSDSETSRG